MASQRVEESRHLVALQLECLVEPGLLAERSWADKTQQSQRFFFLSDPTRFLVNPRAEFPLIAQWGWSASEVGKLVCGAHSVYLGVSSDWTDVPVDVF